MTTATQQIVKYSLYFIVIVATILCASYLLQPLKEGKGNSRETKYEWVTNWPQLPGAVKLGNPTGIGIDTNQNIIVFHRAQREWGLLGDMPDKPIESNTILFIDKDNGTLIGSWGANLFIMPHGLTVDKYNNIWVTDVGLHQVFKFSHAGKLLMKLGEAKVAGNDRLHFNMPTDIAVADDGSFYVSDGYGNSRIIKFSATGEYVLEWGHKGTEAGAFNIPHAVCLDRHNNVFVADRENNRVQMFDSSGRFLKEWRDKSFGSMCSVFVNKATSKLFAADDVSFLKLKHRGSDIIILDSVGNIQSRMGRTGCYNGATSWYHDLVADAEQNIYVGDILGNSLQKFRKVDGR